MKTGVALLALFLPLTALAQADRATPPPPAAPREVHVPQPAEKILANGMRVIVIEKKGIPLVSARLMITTGGEADPAGREGLADMTGSLLTKGTKTMSAEEIARGIEALGATIESGAGWDSSYVALTTLAPNFAAAMAYVADVTRNPVFATSEIERLRAQNLDALSVSLKDPESLASYVASRVVFPGEPYGHNLGGTPKSLQRITRADITGFHASHYRPGQALLVVAGDVKADDVFATSEKLFGDWKTAAPLASAEPAPITTAREAKPRVVVVDMPDAGQAAVIVTERGIARVDPSYITSQVANMVLGGDYSSRLNQEVRIKRGLSYGAFSGIDARRQPGPFIAQAQTKNESAADVAAIIHDQISALAGAPVPESELTPRKANLIGRFGRAIETSAGLVSRIGSLALYGLPLSEINRYVAEVQGVSGEEVEKFAAERLTAAPADIVIVGDVKKFGASFKEKFPNAEIIPIDQLDLDAPMLRK